MEACGGAHLMMLHEHFNYLDRKLKKRHKDVECQAAGDDLAARLMTMPCVNPITSRVLAAELGDGKQFKCGRDYSASIGLVPKQHSTGGRTVLLGISKRGDRNQRGLAFKWIRIVYRCWKTSTVYDENVYLQTLLRHGSPLIMEPDTVKPC
jgi:transposase